MIVDEQVDIIENIIRAVSVLNKTDEYADTLVDKLSECDSLNSDYTHFIENTPVEQVNLKKLYMDMQDNFKMRRKIKKDLSIKQSYNIMSDRLNNSANREMLIQKLKNLNSQLNTTYKNRILTEKQVQDLIIDSKNKRGRGRPRKGIAA